MTCINGMGATNILVKLILKQFKKRLADKDLNCDKCNLVIRKGSDYFKHISKNDITRLHTVCYNVLNIKAIKENANNIEGF